MRTSIKWLKDYVDFDLSPEQLADMLTMAGVPVEGIEYLGKDIDKVITGRIVDVQHHPQADRLSICKLDMGGQIFDDRDRSHQCSARTNCSGRCGWSPPAERRDSHDDVSRRGIAGHALLGGGTDERP